MAREIPEVVVCPVCQHTDWGSHDQILRFMSMDAEDWFPIDTNLFVCRRCGFVRLHVSEEPIQPPEESDH